MTFWEFACAHPIVTLFCVWALCYTLRVIVRGPGVG